MRKTLMFAGAILAVAVLCLALWLMLEPGSRQPAPVAEPAATATPQRPDWRFQELETPDTLEPELVEPAEPGAVVAHEPGAGASEPAAPAVSADELPGPAAGEPVAVAPPDARPPDQAGAGSDAGEPRRAVDPAMKARVARFSDTKIPLEQRQREVKEMARKGDADAAGALMTLGDERVYLRTAAVAALGRVFTPGVAEYIRGKMSDPDSEMVISAIQSYAQHEGERAIPDLVAVLKGNHQREDGYNTEVCSTAVRTLARLGDASAVPALVEELDREKEPGWSLEYGSVVVAALAKLEGGQDATLRYADKLEARKPEDPMARRYYEDKISEAKAAAAGKVNEEALYPLPW